MKYWSIALLAASAAALLVAAVLGGPTASGGDVAQARYVVEQSHVGSQVPEIIVPTAGDQVPAPRAPRSPVSEAAPEVDRVEGQGVRFAGSVGDITGNSVVGARVEVRFGHGSFVLRSGSAQAGAAGRYLLEFPPAYESQFVVEWVIVAASAPGYRSVARSVDPDALGAETFHLDFKLESGKNVSGSIVDRLGSPIGGAKVSLNGGTHTSRSQPDGIYVVPLPDDGVDNVTVSKPGIGFAALTVDLPGDQDAVLQPIVLEGPAALSGVVRLPDFQPANGLLVRAVPIRGEGEPGIPEASSFTHTDGSFEVAGLRPGSRYEVLVGPQRDSVATVVAPEAGLEVVADLCQLEVSVVDSRGEVQGVAGVRFVEFGAREAARPLSQSIVSVAFGATNHRYFARSDSHVVAEVVDDAISGRLEVPALPGLVRRDLLVDSGEGDSVELLVTIDAGAHTPGRSKLRLAVAGRSKTFTLDAAEQVIEVSGDYSFRSWSPIVSQESFLLPLADSVKTGVDTSTPGELHLRPRVGARLRISGARVEGARVLYRRATAKGHSHDTLVDCSKRRLDHRIRSTKHIYRALYLRAAVAWCLRPRTARPDRSRAWKTDDRSRARRHS